jgi:hypothetical protein
MNHTITMTPDEVAGILTEHLQKQGWATLGVTFDVSSTTATAFSWCTGVRIEVRASSPAKKRKKR